MSAEPIHLRVSVGVAQIVIDRAVKRNAMSVAMWRSLPELVCHASAEPDAKVLLLRGANASAFASGVDLEEITRAATSSDAGSDLMALVEAAQHALAACSKPVIAMIQGFCVGGGVELAMACDLRFASDAAQFAIPPAKLGLVYGHWSTRRLIELVGAGNARDLLFSARPFCGAEAYRLGLVERVFPDEELERETLRYAATLCERSQYSIQAAKSIIAGIGEGASDETPEMAAWRQGAFEGADLEEGLRAFAQKRRPAFTWR